jgi:hypothetical protein
MIQPLIHVLKIKPDGSTGCTLNWSLLPLGYFFGLVAVLSWFKWFKTVAPWSRGLTGLDFKTFLSWFLQQ